MLLLTYQHQVNRYFTPDALSRIKETTFVIKEGAQYRLKVVFKYEIASQRIQHEVVSGLKYLHVVKKGMIKGVRYLIQWTKWKR
jgi:Rho GDP-dissociation inhibitor